MSRVYQFSVGEAPSTLCVLHVDGVEAPLHTARVSAEPINRRWPGHQRSVEETEYVGFALFATDGPADITMKPNRSFERAVVNPRSKGVTPLVEDGVIRFTIPGPGFYSVELDGYHNAIYLFADAEKQYEADINDPNVIYYGKGVHNAGCIELHSNQTLFIDEGAVVFARIFAKDADNIRIIGHGILDNSRNTEDILFEFGEKEIEQFKKGFAVTNAARKHTVELNYCDNVEIDGITIRDSLVYNIRPIGCRGIDIRNVKLIGNWRYNSDGIDMHNCEHVRISDCFIRTYDDSICVKGFDYAQNEADMLHDGYLHDTFHDVLIERCVIWNDWGRALEFGAETHAREIYDVTFRDCDIIRVANIACDIQNVDYADIHDVLFDNIRVCYDEVTQEPRLQKSDTDVFVEDPSSAYMPLLLGSFVTYIPEYSKGDTKRGINRDITFRNIQVSAPAMPPSVFRGFDAEHQSRDITVDGLYLNGKRVEGLEDANITIGDFTSNISFK